ncbi:hypothetical protein BLOT_013888 [Blomia tropicalis]|nr:hypothetical protein BLOT_013888 [Blomia tropicalis]
MNDRMNEINVIEQGGSAGVLKLCTLCTECTYGQTPFVMVFHNSCYCPMVFQTFTSKNIS